MIFTERRLANDGLSTVSELMLDGVRLCFTLEPGPNTPAHPRKPAGRYELVLRRAGGFHTRYKKRFPAFFDGIPHILVPRRQWIEAHIGNTIADTEGCSLFGAAYEGPRLSSSRHYEVRRSEEAFRRVYPRIRAACEAGPCWWETLDEGEQGVA